MILAPFVGATIDQPALYLGGELDLIAGNTPEALAALPDAVPGLQRCRRSSPAPVTGCSRSGRAKSTTPSSSS